MNLVVDIGNSRTKISVFRERKQVYSISLSEITMAGLKKILTRFRIESSILSTVAGKQTAIRKLLRSRTAYYELSQRLPLPVRNDYKTKKTLGNDRLANAAGAASLFPGKNVLVIDAGTCVKYDFVSAGRQYCGGAISPGLHMRYRALSHFTEKLPLVAPARNVKRTGATTNASIRSGVQYGMLLEMNGFVNAYRKEYPGLKTILTGGDARYFAHLFNLRIFAAPNLTATGLNEILQHQLDKK